MIASYTTTSQNIKKDSITLAKSTLRSMARTDKKCKANLLSYTTAFNQKSKLLDKMIKTNARMFFELEENREQRKNIDLKIAQLKQELKQKKTNRFVKTAVGTALIITGTLIINNNYKNWQHGKF